VKWQICIANVSVTLCQAKHATDATTFCIHQQPTKCGITIFFGMVNVRVS